ncbi:MULTISPECIES: HK97 family phage prohead protease [Roseomonas]|uniref:Phage Prohead Protease n=1 Tax=Roseomonas mucosa TaxID=207340 RepID=A0A4Y1N3H1_9PROT|nr:MULTISPECIES: HK97 family phage prohead protease [Roseomonas]AWV24698.1 Phage Prohead Protease [Roseomonas mucosa]MDT8277663.1 HK97 family phage prohead protease [Roseomonas mucosa]MDT8353873.1 HK97 family phage prohead protease [Roseomonas mucosa]MDU7525009.1 HK97 family phage prohead protease [Roseomonas mucosa]SUE43024.1 phage prohead protease, HK97 family [Roseomonas gilardii subsp. rosea]
MNTAARLPEGLEHRAAVELRAAAGRRLEGRVASFGVAARIGGEFLETIAAGAFAATLADGHDILALMDHDPSRLLARTSSGTLRLTEDAQGLAFSLDVPDTSLGRDVLALAERRDLGGMSFGFRPLAEAWPSRDQRELRAVELVEVSVVTAFPAYPQTAIAARARSTGSADALRRRRLMEML